MNSPLKHLDELGDLIRQLQKIDSKLQAGQFIAAYRENRRIIANLEEAKKHLIEAQEPKEGVNE
ncbi:MAG: hypothetical protein WC119_02015 [Synergistaceae bacterium]